MGTYPGIDTKALQLWGAKNNGNSLWKPARGALYWHSDGFVVRTYTQESGRPQGRRVCVTCCKTTDSVRMPQCKGCGGTTTRVNPICCFPSCGCNARRHCPIFGAKLCETHFIAQDAETRGCAECRQRPQIGGETEDANLCHTCVGRRQRAREKAEEGPLSAKRRRRRRDWSADLARPMRASPSTRAMTWSGMDDSDWDSDFSESVER